MDIKDARSLSASAQEELRKRAVKAVLGGMKQTDAARAYGVTRQAIGRWIKTYRVGGQQALTVKPQGRPLGGSVKESQASRLLEIMETRMPDEVGISYPLWTSEAVARLVERETGLRLSLWTIRRLLRRWGLDLQKPLKRAIERNPREVRRWVKDSYPAIVRTASAENSVIFWATESSFGNPPAHAGEAQPPRPVALAVSNQGHLRFLVAPADSGIGPKLAVAFLDRLLLQAKRRRILLIAEPLTLFSSPQVTAWLTENERHLKLFLLPGAGRDGPATGQSRHRAA